MTTRDQILDDMKTAMKAKDALTLGVLRMAKAKMIEFETSGQDKELDEEAMIAILKNMIKQRSESSKVFRENDREELAKKEDSEIAVLKNYLPEAVSEDVIRSIVADVVESTGASEMKQMGQVMGQVMGKLKQAGGLVDGSLVQNLVKEALS